MNQAPAAPPQMEPTIPGADSSRVPAGTVAEFGPRPLDEKTRNELDSLEREINVRLSGTPVPPGPAPVAPATEMRLEQAAPPAPVAQSPFTPPAPLPAPVQGLPVPPGVQVPQKFINPDGTMAPERVEQALVNLEQYLAKERELSAPPPPQYQQPYPAYPAQQAPQGFAPNPYPPGYGYPAAAPNLEDRINEDLRHNPGATVVGLMRAAVQTAQDQGASRVKALEMQLELQEIGRTDPSVFTKAGLDRLSKVRADNPWLNNSPTPWLHAHRLAGGVVVSAQQQPVAVPGMPPVPGRHAAPIVPGGAVAPVAPTGPVMTSEAELRRYLNEKFPNDPMKQSEFIAALATRSQGR